MNRNDERKPASKTHKEMVSEWMLHPEFKAAYDALESKYRQLYKKLRTKR